MFFRYRRLLEKKFLNTLMNQVKLHDRDIICSKFDIYNQKKK